MRYRENISTELFTMEPQHGPGTTHVIFVLYLDDATFIFQEPLRFHVITSLSSSTLRKADVFYIQL
jgi:hypothetical protein